jgi:hypothetical protein
MLIAKSKEVIENSKYTTLDKQLRIKFILKQKVATVPGTHKVTYNSSVDSI